MVRVVVGRWGKSLAVRLPGAIADAIGLQDGERVELDVRDSEIVVRRAVSPVKLEELFTGKTAEEWRALYAGAFDWGPDVGREIVEP